MRASIFEDEPPHALITSSAAMNASDLWLVKCADDYEVLLPAVSMTIGPSIMWLTSSL